MIESPLIQELWAERIHPLILRVLTGRFGNVPAEIVAAVRTVQEGAKLDDLVEWASRCPDLEAFRSRLMS